MKTPMQIQRVHDAIVPVLCGELPVRLSGHDRLYFAAVASVLCWILEHDHNPSFARELESLEQNLARQGFRLEFGGN